MTNTEMALLQLDNYGPWTVTPEPRREMHLQSMQSRLYGDIAQFVGTRDGYVFPAGFDNMVAVTNGFTIDDLESMQNLVAERYPVTMSVSVASGDSPGTALAEATTALQDRGSAQSADRSAVLCGETLRPTERSPSDVQIAHFDVVDAIACYTDELSAYDTHVTIDTAYARLRDRLYERHDALSFFVGGDNVIAVCPGLSEDACMSAIDDVRSTVGVELRVGSGTGVTACAAGLLAKDALETCRHHGTLIEQGSHHPGAAAEPPTNE